MTPEGTEVPRCQMDPACIDHIRNQPLEHRAQVRTRLSLRLVVLPVTLVDQGSRERLLEPRG